MPIIRNNIKPLALFLGALVVSCGGTHEQTLSVTASPKQLHFSWTQDDQATFYRINENIDGTSGFTQMGALVSARSTSTTIDIATHLRNWDTTRYMVESCVNSACTAGKEITAKAVMLDAIGMFVSPNPQAAQYFGSSVAVSGDGNTLAVGVRNDSSGATGIDGDSLDSSAPASGAVYLFTRGDSGWVQQAYIKASNTGAGDEFGQGLALSDDGNTLAVGARYEDSSNSDGADELATDTGAVYLFTRDAGVWTQQALLKASNIEPTNSTESADHFGESLALSADGNTLAVGAPSEDSAADGINGTAAHDCSTATNCLPNSGALYVFTRADAAWTQEAYLKASNHQANDLLGKAISISRDGNTLLAGAPHSDAVAAGSAYVFTRSNATWSEDAVIQAPNTEAYDRFASSVAISGNGTTVAIGSPNEQSGATGINGDQLDNSQDLAGAAYIFSRGDTAWTEQAYVKASNSYSNAHFGQQLSLNQDGTILAIGAPGEDSSAVGIDGDQNDHSTLAAGAVYMFVYKNSSWLQRTYVKSKVSEANQLFGSAVALSSNGGTLAVGTALDVDGNADAGGVFLY